VNASATLAFLFNSFFYCSQPRTLVQRALATLWNAWMCLANLLYLRRPPFLLPWLQIFAFCKHKSWKRHYWICVVVVAYPLFGSNTHIYLHTALGGRGTWLESQKLNGFLRPIEIYMPLSHTLKPKWPKANRMFKVRRMVTTDTPPPTQPRAYLCFVCRFG